MYLSIHNRSLLSGMMAGAVALAAASACSRSDRANTRRDSTQTGSVAPADSHASAATSATSNPNTATQPTTGTQPSSADTVTGTPSTSGNASTPSPKTGHRHGRPRSSATRVPSAGATSANADQGVAGYQAMGQDSSTAPGNVHDSATASASASASTSADTMVRDTSAALAQGDTAAPTEVGTSNQAPADTATIGDTAVTLAKADTSRQTEVAAKNGGADTTARASDSTAGRVAERVHPDTVSQKADKLAKHDQARIRPPEDSTEVLGNVTTDNSAANADATAVGAAGVASTGNIATGAEAVAQMSRGGERCTVAAADDHRDVLWDMASSPATLNPCGTGTMTLPKIWTGEKK